MSYWIYQHLGNLAPREIRAEGMLDRARRARRRRAVPPRVGARVGGVHAPAGRLPLLLRAPAGRCHDRDRRLPQRACAPAGRAVDGRRRGVGVRGRALHGRCPARVDRHVAAGVRRRRHPRPAAVGRARVRRRVGTARTAPGREVAAADRPRPLARLRALVRCDGGAARRSRERIARATAGVDLGAVGRHPLQLPQRDRVPSPS